MFAWPPSVMSIDPKQGVFGQCKGFKTSRCNMPFKGFANDVRLPRPIRVE